MYILFVTLLLLLNSWSDITNHSHDMFVKVIRLYCLIIRYCVKLIPLCWKILKIYSNIFKSTQHKTSTCWKLKIFSKKLINTKKILQHSAKYSKYIPKCWKILKIYSKMLKTTRHYTPLIKHTIIYET